MIRNDPAGVPIYEPRRLPRYETIRLRDHDMHLTRWGPDADPAARESPVLLLHGFLDTAATFQFLVDEFAGERPLIGLDWRGFGRSEWSSGGYWFHDYLADLDALIDRLCGGIPARIIGHSMGGNVAMLYAGLRADKVRSIVNLEGFGLPRSAAHQAPAQIRKWLDQVKSVPIVKPYDSVDQLCAIVAFRYPRFTPAQARFLAAAWSEGAATGVELLGDPRH
ncbi:MAG: alpha/beta fold hydrolase, partial [Pseudomonadota bacterium]|nr:alpha/beta fold hydrolase [Pseudomonadota bacterium]